MYFIPLVFSVDGMTGRDAEAFVKQFGKYLAIKWELRFSQVINYFLT